MAGLFTLESVDPQIIYDAAQQRVDQTGGALHCYSRLPLRQLLRFLSSKHTTWWISEHPSPHSLSPDSSVLHDHMTSHLPAQNDVVVVESLDWLVHRNGDAQVLEWLQRLDGLAKLHIFEVVLPVDPLAFEVRFWMRLRSLAPKFAGELESPDINDDHEEDSVPLEGVPTEQESPIDEVLVHLVSLPRLGFNKVLLAKRMLQWKRMGFDLSELEPAMSMEDLSEAFALYQSTETQVVKAIDGLRYINAHEPILTTTERHRYQFRFMHLLHIDETTAELLELVSTRQAPAFSLESSHP